MGKKLLVVSAVLALGLTSCSAAHAQPAAPWTDGESGLSYRLTSDSGTELDIRADKACSLIYTENFFYGNEGKILYTTNGLLKNAAGDHQTLSAGEVVAVDLGGAGNGATRTEMGSVACLR